MKRLGPNLDSPHVVPTPSTQARLLVDRPATAPLEAPESPLVGASKKPRRKGFVPAGSGHNLVGIRGAVPRPPRVADIEAAFTKKNSPWSALRRLTTPKDLADVKNMCQEINPERWEEIFVQFWDGVVAAREARPATLVARDEALPEDWFHEPFYYCYPQFFGTANGKSEATFDDLVRQLDYLEKLGVKNLYLLPHYESPMADGGYDVSEYAPRKALGGEDAYQRFMSEANARGFRVVTDAPFNHTSVEHRWFQDLQAGDPNKREYYVQVNGREKIDEKDIAGDIVSRYRDPDGTETEMVCIFPDVDRTHHLEVNSGGQRLQVFREFYPFQVDLDLRNPSVLGEVFNLLAKEANDGVLGKRTDAIAHWMKQPGTRSDGLPETHGLQAMLKSFLSHVAPGAIVMPEAVRSARENARYAGIPTEIAGRPRASEGDALFAFEMQGALREMLYLGTTEPFWTKVFEQPELPENAAWVNLLGHHDETYMGFVSEKNRDRMRAHIEASGGKIYKNEMSGGARVADCLGGDPERIATAMFALYLAPGTPAVYYGAEIGAKSQPDFADAEKVRHHATLQGQGVDVDLERAYDPRDLQRGPIPAADFARAEADGHPAVRTVQRMNALRRTHPCLRSSLLTPVDNGHDEVLSMVRFAPEGQGPALMALANLDGAAKELTIPAAQLADKMGCRISAHGWKDLLTERGVRLKRDGANLTVTLPPYGRLLLTPTA